VAAARDAAAADAWVVVAIAGFELCIDWRVSAAVEVQTWLIDRDVARSVEGQTLQASRS